MKSVADIVRRERQESVARRSVEKNVERALALGEEAVALYAAAEGISPSLARKRLRAVRRAGRVPSACLIP